MGKTIIINNEEFDFDLGVKLVKLKYGEELPPGLESLDHMWADIVPATFADIGSIANIEQRRAAFDCMGIEKMLEQTEPTEIGKETLTKEVKWVNGITGKRETKTIEDTYTLYRIDSEKLYKDLQGLVNNMRGAQAPDSYILEFKDTSTDRRYLLWIDPIGVFITNTQSNWLSSNMPREEFEKHLNPISAIAWSMMTDVPKGYIKRIIRQGDCIIVEPRSELQGADTPSRERHLTETEYRELIDLES